jgi:hypothetical protein
MRRTVKVLSATVAAAGIVSLLSAGAASAEILGRRELAAEMRANQALKQHVRDRGLPDLAQRWNVQASWPWESYIVRLFYLKPRTEIAFSRAFVLDRPRIGLMRYQRPIPEETAAELQRFLATAPSSIDEDRGVYEEPLAGEAAARAEAAAKRAEQAAEMTELGAAGAEQAAKRLDSLATEAEGSFRKQLKK